MVRRGCRHHWGWTLNTKRTVKNKGKLAEDSSSCEVLHLEPHLGIDVRNHMYCTSGFRFYATHHKPLDTMELLTQKVHGVLKQAAENMSWVGVEALVEKSLDKINFKKRVNWKRIHWKGRVK